MLKGLHLPELPPVAPIVVATGGPTAEKLKFVELVDVVGADTGGMDVKGVESVDDLMPKGLGELETPLKLNCGPLSVVDVTVPKIIIICL